MAVVVGAIATHAASAQCPDGTPPPCGKRVPVEAPIDPNRIVVLPFRVTSADTLLGEGFAELLASQLTGEGSPRAVDMATVLTAWRKAGGGLRSPMPRAQALRLARSLGAGLLSDGSIVGLGNRLTITTALIAVPSGAVRAKPAPVTGTFDSLDVALRQATADLLAASGAPARMTDGAQLTRSPEAMRYYLTGLGMWRRGRDIEAADAFDRAIAADSTFAQALFSRWRLASIWGVAGGPAPRRVWAQRTRMSRQERVILEAVFGPEYPSPRTIDARIAAREMAASMMPDSPDALFEAGDYWFRNGAAVDPVNQLQRARAYVERSVALDSQATAMRRLLEIGIRLRDTALLRRVLPAYLRTDDVGKWAGAWLVSAATGDTARLAGLRRRPDMTRETLPRSDRLALAAVWPATSAVAAAIPGRLLDEMLDRWYAALPEGEVRSTLIIWGGFAQAARFRSKAAERMWSRLKPDENAQMDEARLNMALAGAGNGIDTSGALARLAVPTPDSEDNLAFACLIALVRIQRGDTATLDRSRAAKSPRCQRSLELQRLARDTAGAGPLLARYDSAARNAVSSLGAYDMQLLARAFEASGNMPRALAVIRYRTVGSGSLEFTWNLPDEGRIAALVGDTTGAIRAYKSFLEITADADEAYTPRREAVRAALAAIRPPRR